MSGLVESAIAPSVARSAETCDEKVAGSSRAPKSADAGKVSASGRIERMATIRATVHFDAPIERVFGRFTDFKRYPEWHVNNPEVLEVTGPPAVGTRIHSGWRILGRRFQAWAEVTVMDRPRFLR